MTQPARNAQSNDLLAANEDGSVVHTVKSRALSRRSDVPLGPALDNLRSAWWIVTMYPTSDQPVCYVLTLEEVKQYAHEDTKNGKSSFWLPFKEFTQPEFENAWHRLEAPA